MTKKLKEKTIYQFLIKGQPLPRPRPRVSRRGTYFPKKYQDYFESIIEILRYQFLKNRWKQIKHNCHLIVYFYRKGKLRSDWDNLGKSISDALQQAGIIENDNLIICAHITIIYGSTDPKTEITIW